MKIPNPPSTRLQEIISYREGHRDILDLIDSGASDGAVAMSLGMNRHRLKAILSRAAYRLQWVCYSRVVEGKIVTPKGDKFRVLPILNKGGKKAGAEFLGMSLYKFNQWLRRDRRNLRKAWVRLPISQPEALDYARGAARLREFEIDPEKAQQVRDYLLEYSTKYQEEVAANAH